MNADGIGVRLRAAQPEDALAVAGVHVRAWQAGYRGLLPDDYLDTLRPEDRAGRYTFGEPGAPETIVATEEGGAIRGFAAFGASRDEETRGAGELMALYVEPERWGRGVGRALMKEARARLAGHGFEEAVLWLLAGNARAERFYRFDGWAPDGSRRMGEVWGLTVDEIRYRTALRGGASSAGCSG